MVFCQAGFEQLFCTEINYLSIRKAFGEKQGLLEWTKPDWSQLEFILQGFFSFFFSLMTHTSRIHAASGCFRNKLTSPEGWPSIDATDSALGIYAVRLIIKEPWHKMNVNTHIYLSHSMFFSLIHFPFLLPESLLREAKQPPDLHTDKCLKPTSTSCYKRVRQLLIRHMRMFPYISSVESIIH